VKGNTYHYTAGVCDSTGKKTFSKTDECSLHNANNGVAIYQEDCCYVGEWDGGECNVDDRPGYKKYTRHVPNAGICTGAQLGNEHEVGDPTVKYTRDKSACDKDCVIGDVTYVDSDANGNQFMLENSNSRKFYGRKVFYAGSTPAVGLGDNWCSEWEAQRFPNLDNGVLMHRSSNFLPDYNTPGEYNGNREKIIAALGLNQFAPGDENYFQCAWATISGGILNRVHKDSVKNCGSNELTSWH
jgi:hypothetical protein